MKKLPSFLLLAMFLPLLLCQEGKADKTHIAHRTKTEPIVCGEEQEYVRQDIMPLNTLGQIAGKGLQLKAVYSDGIDKYFYKIFRLPFLAERAETTM